MTGKTKGSGGECGERGAQSCLGRRPLFSSGRMLAQVLLGSLKSPNS